MKMKVTTHRANDLSSIGDNLGIYSWFLSYDYKSERDEYHKIFRSSQLESEVKGVFKDVYSGKIQQKEYDFEKEMSFSKFLNVASLAFCPPLYIGISKNLSDRLETHRNKLNSLINNESSRNLIDDAKPDTDEESENFAIRLSRVINETDTIGIRNLRIKVLEATEKLDRDQVMDVEHYLNRTYTPFYGRK